MINIKQALISFSPLVERGRRNISDLPFTAQISISTLQKGEGVMQGSSRTTSFRPPP
jgi:hypothetical protein